jgi:hypothetical protein
MGRRVGWFVVMLSLLAHTAWAEDSKDTDGGSEDPPVWRGFHVDLVTSDLSGVDTSSEAYENQLSFSLEPSYDLGERQLAKTWAKRLTLGARISLTGELSGSDPAFRSSSFGSPALFSDVPEQVAIAQVDATTDTATSPGDRADGADRRWALSDLSLSASHSRLARIPGLRAALVAGVRVVLPTSLESRISGLYFAPSLYLGLRRAKGRVTVELGTRFVKYFYGADTAPIRHLGDPVIVNGQEVSPETFAHDGQPTPNYGFVNALSVDVDLPRHLALSVGYAIINTFSHTPSTCTVPGLPTADACADGDLLGDTRSGRRDAGWFNVDLDWTATSYLSLGLGLATYEPLRHPNGDVANPFLRVTRDNFSTLTLSVTLSADALAQSLKTKRGSR